MVNELYKLIQMRRKEKIDGSYTCYLFDSGINKILKKCGEECSEVIIAAKDLAAEKDLDLRKEFLLDFKNETADLLFHLLALLVELDVSIEDVNEILRERRGKSQA